jgi:hypothetical protein
MVEVRLATVQVTKLPIHHTPSKIRQEGLTEVI